MIVADFSMNNGRENRNNGNQEKGKEEKEALRRSVRSQKRGTPKASPKFLCGSFSTLRQIPGKIRNPLFLSRAQTTEGAEITMKSKLWVEVSSGDAPRHSQHPLSRLFQLKLRAPGEDGNVAFEIVKHQRAHAISPLLARGHGIDR